MKPTLTKKKNSYNRDEILSIFSNSKPSTKMPKSKSGTYRAISEIIKSGEIVRTGRNSYSLKDINKKSYEHNYSSFAVSIASYVKKHFNELEFRIFETRQFNEFMNQQIAKNAIFLSVESDLEEFVFQKLSEKYPGKILLKPSRETMWTYLQNDSIIINRLPSESPESSAKNWRTVPEKFLVDLQADKLLNSLVPSSQFEFIYDGFLEKYLIDTQKMFRYARRRTAMEKLEKYIKSER